MNILPEEIVEYIITFTLDRRGYNIFLYNQRKKDNWFRMRRLNTEIRYFKYVNCSIAWLRGTAKQRTNMLNFKKSLKNGSPEVLYHIGCFRSYTHEFMVNLTRKF